jgi:hypothetical protein
MIRIMHSKRRWAGHVELMAEKRNAYWILLEKATRNETTGKT